MRLPLRYRLTAAGLLVSVVSVLAAWSPATSAAPAAGSTVGGPELATHGVVQAAHTKPLPERVTTSSWLVADAGTGVVLAAKDPHGRFLPASTQKVLTALTLLPRLKDRSHIVVGDSSDENIDGTRVGLVQGGKYPVKLLFQCMLMASGNDCANALARANGGVGKTVKEMNAVAKSLHADDTVAGTPSGLDAPGQGTSAYDLALILRAAVKIPDFRLYNTTQEAQVPAVPPKYGPIGFVNKDLLLKNYHGVVAAKNGFTDAAQQTFIAVVKKGNRTMVVTLMHGERYPVEMWRQAADLAEWGFSVPAGSAGVGRLVSPIQPAPKPKPKPKPSASPSPSASDSSSSPSAAGSSPATDVPANASHNSSTSSDVWWVVLVAVVVILAGAVTTLFVRRRRAAG